MTTFGTSETKISEFPADVQMVENNWQSFDLDCDGTIFTVTLKPKVFKKLEQAQENYPIWVEAIAFSEAQDAIEASRDQP